MAAGGTAFLEGQQLLGTESLVVDLASGFNQVLEVGTRQEVSQIDKLAVGFILDVDDAPTILSTADLPAIDDDVLFTAHNRKRNDILQRTVSSNMTGEEEDTEYLDLNINGTLLVIEFIIIIGIHFQVVKSKLLLDSLLESLAFIEGQGIGLGDDGDDIDHVGQLLEYDNVNGLETTWPLA